MSQAAIATEPPPQLAPAVSPGAALTARGGELAGLL
jgi:hypothetical protein